MERGKKAKLKDISIKAGVSTALVSYVLNGKHTDRINSKTADRIKSIAQELNYTPNFFARGLKSQSTKTIGLIIPDLAHSFFIRLAKYIEIELNKLGYMLLIGSSDEKIIKQEFILKSFLDRNVDGLIILPLEGSESSINHLSNTSIPYVLTDRYFPNLSFNFITTDNYYGIQKLTSGMLEKGADSIALLTIDSSMEHFTKRKDAFIDTCTTFNIKNHKILSFNVNTTFEDFETRLYKVFHVKNPVKALVCTTDFLAMNAAKFFVKHSIRIPDDVALSTFDYAPYFSVFPFPIYYYDQPLEKIGQKITSYILDTLESPSKKSIQTFIKGEVSNTHSGKQMNLLNLIH